MAVRSIGFPRNVANGVLGLDGNAQAALANLPIRVAQVMQAARPVVVARGGSISGFYSSLGGPDVGDGAWDAVNGDFAPLNGKVYAALSAYLTALGLGAGDVATALATIWANAPAIGA